MKNTTFIKKLVVALTVFLTAITSYGCQVIGEDESEDIQNASGEPIVLGLPYFPTAQIFQLADDLGYYEAEGVKVEIILYDNIEAFTTDMREGKLDIIGLAFMDVIAEWEQGYPFKVVTAGDYSYGADAIISRKGKGIDAPEDLKNQTIAVDFDTVSEFFLDFVLTTHANLNPDDVNKIDYTAKEATEAFLNNEVDVIVTFEPHIQEAIIEGNGQIVADSKNERGLIVDVWVVDSNKMQQREDEFIKVFDAWFKAVDYFKEYPEEATEIMGEHLGISQKEFAAQFDGLYILDLRDNITAFSFGAGFESLHGTGRLIAEFYQSKGILEEMPEIEEILDDSVIKQLYYDTNH